MPRPAPSPKRPAPLAARGATGPAAATAPGAVLLLLAAALAGCLGAPAPAGDAGGPGPGGAAGGWANVVVTHANGPASELTLAVNPLDPLNLVGGAKDYTLGADPGPGCPEHNVWSGVYWSRDGGRTWGNALMPGYPGDANATLLSAYTCNSDPVVVFGPDGTAYYSGLAYGGAGQGGTGLCADPAMVRCGRSIWIARSTDGGETWEGFVNVAEGDGQNSIVDKQWFAVNPADPANLVMTWIDFAGLSGTFYIAASFDGAATWTPAVPLAEADVPVHQFIMPVFAPDGTVYVTWRHFGTGGTGGPQLPAGRPPELPLDQPGQPRILFTRNVPGTPGFLPPRAIAPVVDIDVEAEYRLLSYPVPAVDPASGALYVAWPDGREGHADILLIRSDDGGDTWTDPVRVNQDPGTADQFMSWVTVDEEGGVLVGFYDRSADPANRRLGFTVARSTDQGATWTSLAATTETWDLPEGCYHQAGFPFLGDYVGLAAGGGVVHPFWADGRSGRCDAMTAAIPYAAFGPPGPGAAAAPATTTPAGPA